MKTFKGKLPEINIKYKSGDYQRAKILQSSDAAKVFRLVFNADTIEWSETMMALFLNRANNTIGYFKVSQGGVSGTVIDSKILFPPALLCGASAIILCHNHPSGNVTPSRSDVDLTKKLIKAAKLLDIQIIDHIILTNKSYYSMMDNSDIL